MQACLTPLQPPTPAAARIAAGLQLRQAGPHLVGRAAVRRGSRGAGGAGGGPAIGPSSCACGAAGGLPRRLRCGPIGPVIVAAAIPICANVVRAANAVHRARGAPTMQQGLRWQGGGSSNSSGSISRPRRCRPQRLGSSSAPGARQLPRQVSGRPRGLQARAAPGAAGSLQWPDEEESAQQQAFSFGGPGSEPAVRALAQRHPRAPPRALGAVPRRAAHAPTSSRHIQAHHAHTAVAHAAAPPPRSRRGWRRRGAGPRSAL